MRLKRVISLFFCILMLAVSTAAAGSQITTNLDVDGGWKYLISNDYTTGACTHPNNLFVASNSNSPTVVANATFDGINTVFATSSTEGNLYIGKLYPETNTRYRIQVNITSQDSNPTIYLQNGLLFLVGINKNAAGKYIVGINSAASSYPRSLYLTDSRYADLTIEYSGSSRTCRIWETSNPSGSTEITCYSNQDIPYIMPSSNLFDCEFDNCGSGATFKILKFEQLTPKKIVTVEPANDRLAYGFDGPRGNYTDGKNWLKEHGQRATLWLDLPYIQNDAALRQDCQDLVDNWGWEVGIHFTHSLNFLSWEAAVTEMDTETNAIASIFGRPVLSWCSLGNEENATHRAYMYANHNSIHRNSPVSNADAISGEDYMISSSSVSNYTNIKFWDLASQHGTFKPVYEHSVKTPLEEPNSIDYNDFVRIMTNYTNQGIKIIPFGEWYYTAVNTNPALNNVLFSDSDSHFNFNTHGYNTNVTIYDPNGEGVWFENSSAITTYLDGTNETQLVVNTSSSKTIQKLKAAFVSNGNLAVTPSIWNSTGDYHKKWSEYSSSSISTNYVVGDFPANSVVKVYYDGTLYATVFVNSTGYINWNYAGKSGQHEFELSYNQGDRQPVPNFIANPKRGPAPLTVQFTDLSQNTTGWSWDFGDGTSISNEQNPVHTYYQNGTYTVSLTASNEHGTNAKTDQIFVGINSNDLVAVFSASPTSGSAPLSVAFIDESTGYPATWKWVFGDGTTSTARYPVHVYNKTGLYTVSLTVANGTNSSAVTKSNYIAVTNGVSAPATAFSANTASGTAPLTVSFADLSAGSPTAWKWTFGDGTTSTEQNPVHVYSKAGLYTVSLNASNAAGSKILTKSNYIVVSNVMFAPVTDFSATPASGTAPVNVTFTDTSTGSPTAWKWTFGDGNTSTDKNPVHTYNKSGLYSVTLTASNANGSNSLTKTNYIAVSGVSGVSNTPVTGFSTSLTSGIVPFTVSFTDQSTGSPASWAWNFGDGNTSKDQNPVHTFNKSGLYSVSLTSSNSNGSNALTKTGHIAVSGVSNAPVTSFSASPISGNEPLTVNFTDQSTGSPTSWKWTFGDGNTSNETNPVHTYNKTGLYLVGLIVNNANGSNTLTKTSYVAVSNSLDAVFSAAPTSGSAPLSVNFTDQSTGSPTSWKWTFGDGNVSNETNPVYVFNKTGQYTVSLTVNNQGSSSTETRSRYISVSK